MTVVIKQGAWLGARSRLVKRCDRPGGMKRRVQDSRVKVSMNGTVRRTSPEESQISTTRLEISLPPRIATLIKDRACRGDDVEIEFRHLHSVLEELGGASQGSCGNPTVNGTAASRFLAGVPVMAEIFGYRHKKSHLFIVQPNFWGGKMRRK